MSKVSPLPTTRPQPTVSELATVTGSEAGEAKSLAAEDGTPLAVLGHLASVDALRAGDRVLVSRQAAGAIILGRLRRPGEGVQASIHEADGRIQIEAARSLTLRSGNSCMELSEEGTIRVDGRQVHSFAEGRMVLQGGTIELN